MMVLYQRPQPVVPVPRPDLSALARQANNAMSFGDLTQAETMFRDGLSRARQAADLRYVSGFLTSLGVIRVNQSRYRQALEFFLQSQDAARQAGSPKEFAFAALNIGVIYTRLGDWQRGHLTMAAATRNIAPADLPSTLHHNLADYESRLHHYPAADRHFRLAIDTSERTGRTALVAAGWERWGISYLERGQTGSAERCFLESYRLHRLAKRPEAEQIHYGLARLAIAQGDLAEARRRSQQYLAAARSRPMLYPLWEAYRVCAEIEERDGQLRAAYQLYLRGADWARQSRAERLPTSQLAATAESALQPLYLGLIRTAQSLHQRRPDPALLLTALEAAEESRDASFVETTSLLNDEYWQLLDQLQRLQAQRIVQDTLALSAQTDSLRAQLALLESAAGLRLPSPASPRQRITQAREALSPDEAILVYRTGDAGSYLWILTRRSIRFQTLPSEKLLSAQIASFRADALAGHALESADGKKLFSEIIGELSAADPTNRRWTLVPDGPLHELPFAALPWPSRRGSETYLVEHRSIHSASSIASLAAASTRSPASVTFAGIADPIYNSADPRLRPLPQQASVLALFRQTATPTLELARLPGSQAELDAAVRVLRPDGPILLTGGQVHRESFLALLRRRTATLHLATHVVSEAGNPRHALIALGLNPHTREQDLVSADDLNACRHSARLVVMSGCGSGRGEALPGVGLVSLTRAWILSGATGVIGSHWPVPDNSGPLFERFYRYVQHRPGSATEARSGDWAFALQRAQIDSIHQRVPASIWAAYFLTGRN